MSGEKSRKRKTTHYIVQQITCYTEDVELRGEERKGEEDNYEQMT